MPSIRIITIMFVLLFAVLFYVPQAISAEPTIATNAKQLMLLDDSTDTVLLDRNANEKMYPSSMSKLMTLYVLFGDLKNGSLKLEDTLPVSEKAWRKGGSKMFVRVGTHVAIEDLIRGIIIQSGNDACIVVAEGLAGSEDAFAKRMTDTAKKIGMKHSNFTNATGWPDENHVTSAADLATLSQHLIHDFPDYYHYFKEAEFTYSGITQPNRNLLINRDIGVDGLKTGHTEIAGYGIVLSAVQDGRRLVLVVNGLESKAERAKEGETLLRYGFSHYKAHRLLKAGEPLADIPVWMGAEESISATVEKDAMITLPREDNTIHFVMHSEQPIAAPIAKGEQIGSLYIMSDDTVIKKIPLTAAQDVNKAGFFSRIIKSAKHLSGL